MALFRLIVLGVIAIWAVMYWFGRDEGLPDNRLGYDPEQVAQAEPEPEPAPEPEPEPEPQPEPPPEPEPTPEPEPEPEPAPEPTAPVRPTLSLPAGAPVVIPGVPTAALSGPQAANGSQTPAEPAPEPQPEPQPETQAETQPEPQPTPAPEPAPDIALHYTTPTGVNLRSASTTGDNVIAQLPRGTEVELIGPARDPGWSEVRVVATGDQGFIATRFLAETPPAP